MDGELMEDDGVKKYQIIINGETTNNSRGYTGKAKAIYPTEPEETYEGDFVEGKRTGRGTYTYKNGDIYTGEWRENDKHGIGKLTYLNSGEYFGRFENGKRHGEGVFTYKKSKDVFSGFWKHGNKNGFGKYTFFDTKMKLSGEWLKGNIVEGKWIFPNGIYWEGKFKGNKPTDIGTWFFPSTNTVKGEFKQIEDEEADADPDSGEKPIKLTWKTLPSFYNPEAFDDLNI